MSSGVSPDLASRARAEFFRLAEERALFEGLIGELQARPPTPIELRAVGAMLHSVYTGMEGLLKQLVAEVDGRLPDSAAWHAELLTQAAAATPARAPILSVPLAESLRELMAFRHRFRNAYGFELTWERMRPLALAVFHTTAEFEREIGGALASIGGHA